MRDVSGQRVRKLKSYIYNSGDESVAGWKHLPVK